MQLTGTQFTRTAAVYGNDIATLPDFPAEIRAPAGSLPGVSGFQISFSSSDIHTPGDSPDVLVAMNPAALRTNVGDVPAGGAIVVNEDAFTKQNLAKAGYAENPLEDGSLNDFTVFEIPISKLNARALEGLDMSTKQVDLTKNFFALGIMFWLYERSMEPTIKWIEKKFAARPVIAEANLRALKAGYAFGETTEIFHTSYRVKPAKLPPGTYRNITGNEAAALGFVAATKLAKRDLFYGSYPITPASEILHQLSTYKHFGVRTFQAEDEIAAIGSAIGASFGGALALTASSGPGIALKGEAMGLAVMVELPLVDRQRAARRSLDGHAHQDRAVGPAAGHVRPQRRRTAARRGPGHARRVLRLRHRGLPPRAQVHDAGGLPLRCLPGHRLGALAHPGARRPARHLGAQPHRCRHLPALRARSRHAGAAVGHPGHARAWSTASAASRAQDVSGQRLLRPRQPPAHDRPARAQGRRHRRRHPRAGGLRPRARRPARPRLGQHLRLAAHGRRATAAQRHAPWPTPTCATSTPSRATPARCSRATARCSSPRSTPASCGCSSAAATSSTRWASTGSAASPSPCPRSSKAARLLLER